MTWIRLQLRPIATVCSILYVGGVVFMPAMALSCEGQGEEEAGLSVTPNPLVFNQRSRLEEPITLAASGATGDETEIIRGGVSAIRVTEGPAEWVKLRGANCESKVLKVGGASCVETMRDERFPRGTEVFRAEYELTWKSIRPASIILHTTTVNVKAENVF
jgi:hypothetical protein